MGKFGDNLMKDILLNILNRYLEVFPEEKGRQNKLIDYLYSHNDNEIIDWNNFEGHVVAGGFIYSKENNKFLILYHKDLKMYLYPGGHINIEDKNPLMAAKREIQEETGLSNLEQFIVENEELLPIDIDTHIINYNEKLELPEHYHFDFRYLFIIDRIENIKIDGEEIENYKWIDINDLYNDPNYGSVATKIERVLLLK